MSISVSPLRIAEAPTDMFMTSAPSRFAGQLERRLGPGRGFEKQVDLRPPAQGGALLLDLPVKLDEFLGEIEEPANLRRGQPFNPQQMFTVEDKAGILRNVH